MFDPVTITYLPDPDARVPIGLTASGRASLLAYRLKRLVPDLTAAERHELAAELRDLVASLSAPVPFAARS